ncbi:response regulator transcription factor [Halobacillus karajensis]|uniref:Sensory transduction protein regX3 n=1 Tax=Halobacillus karajensis TaxID=195088 RepID=A0A059NVN7_9BACI|nr:response regulator transcription factor [Halobacillus karajensis]CDQ18469.1 Sensory transduction protein regX3 [Halobacillus karajensis]CDQ23459.1 Sensory transduction protein regX3 [Halobacillus karajensis]CDQ26941.1 Sensory transduction protein regX3 [Halobacillus karajensis]
MDKILIIEDDPAIADLERDYLEMDGFYVEHEEDGTQGLSRGLHGDFDLLLVDIMLPGTSGFEICKKVREKRDIPILMITAKTDDIDKVRGLGIGADDYIVKPFSPNELVARVKAHLSRYKRFIQKEEDKQEIWVKGLHIDLRTRRVKVNEEEVTLTAKEFDLLTFLAQLPHRVFSKEELFEKIWGLDALGDNTTVTVHVRRLRKKIEPHPSQPVFIETVWGVGYRFLD